MEEDEGQEEETQERGRRDRRIYVSKVFSTWAFNFDNSLRLQDNFSKYNSQYIFRGQPSLPSPGVGVGSLTCAKQHMTAVLLFMCRQVRSSPRWSITHNFQPRAAGV